MKRILLKLGAFALLLAVVQVPAEWMRGLSPMPVRDELTAALRDSRQLIFFGDSVLDNLAPGDGDRRTLVEMVRDRLPELTIAKVQGSAFGPEVHEAYLDHLAMRTSRPVRILLAVNLRSLSPEWEPRPEYQYRADRFRLAHGDPAALLFLRPLNALKLYSFTPVSPAEFRARPVTREGRTVGRVRDFLPILTAPPGLELEESQFIFRYMNTVTPASPGVKSLRRIAARCRERGFPVHVYVTPVDVETGERAAGPGFRRQVAANVAVLRDALVAEGLPLLDLSGLLDAGAFDWRRNLVPNEHLTQRGRDTLAKQLASLVQSGK